MPELAQQPPETACGDPARPRPTVAPGPVPPTRVAPSRLSERVATDDLGILLRRAQDARLQREPVVGAVEGPRLQRGRRRRAGELNIVDKSKTKLFKQPFTHYNAWMRDFKRIYEMMLLKKHYRPALEELDEAVEADRRRGEDEADPAPLERVLLKREQRFGINPDGAPVYTRTLSAEVFTELSKEAVIPTDPGAGYPHGAYTHRMQWWVILGNAGQLKHKPRDLLFKTVDPYFVPPEENWPTTVQYRYPELDEVQEADDIPGGLWQAMFDRALRAYGISTLKEMGISNPELMTAELIDGGLRDLRTLRTIIRAQVQGRWGDTARPDKIEAVEADLLRRGFRQRESGGEPMEGVYLAPPEEDA